MGAEQLEEGEGAGGEQLQRYGLREMAPELAVAAMRQAVQENPERRLYYRFDHHLNVEGNKVVARELSKALEGRVP